MLAVVLVAQGIVALQASSAPARVPFGTFAYTATTADKVQHWTWKVGPSGKGGVLAEQRSWEGEVTRFEDDASAQTVWYRTEHKGRDFVFDCRISGRKLSAYRVDRGKRSEASYDLDAAPWYQDWDISLPAWVLSSEKSIEYWCLNDDLSIYKFHVEKKGSQKVTVPAGSFDCVKVQVRITGFLSMFWSGDIFFRASDGLFVKDAMSRGQGAPDTVYELVAAEAPRP